MAEFQRSNKYRVAVHDFDELDVHLRVHRTSNYMIALLGRRDSPLMGACEGGWSRGGKTVEMAVWDVVGSMWKDFRIDRSWTARDVQGRFKTWGLILLPLIPFHLYFHVTMWIFLHTETFRTSRQPLGPLTWSQEARYKFRNYNENEHEFDRRIKRGIEPGGVYREGGEVGAWLWCVKGVVRFLSGSIVAVLLAFTAINESILLHVKVSDRPTKNTHTQNLRGDFSLLLRQPPPSCAIATTTYISGGSLVVALADDGPKLAVVLWSLCGPVCYF